MSSAMSAALCMVLVVWVMAPEGTTAAPPPEDGQYDQEVRLQGTNSQNCSDTIGSCPSPYVRLLGNECLYVSKHALTWIQAREHCQGIMGDLASPKNLFILKSYILHNPDYYGTAAVFLGGRRFEGRWWWLDGRPISSEDFAEGEPNNYFGVENCIDLRVNRHPMLNDNKCSSSMPFVCQYCDHE